MSYDYSLTIMDGEVLAHRPDCPDARSQAALGEPVVTLLDCSKPLPREMKRHSCLDQEEER